MGVNSKCKGMRLVFLKNARRLLKQRAKEKKVVREVAGLSLE